ncbi:hypothetical protein [Paractinoplanes lichenicola]|uniref:hypothetical protein n=1 Tax=Paractinoplanes lichenicola TaxID=2802976 RepID=UPI003F69426F
MIADRLLEKASQKSIAVELGRSPATISRNRHPGTGVYRPHAAQQRAEARRPRPKTPQTRHPAGAARRGASHADRQVQPATGHWEGDLIVGKDNKSPPK